MSQLCSASRGLSRVAPVARVLAQLRCMSQASNLPPLYRAEPQPRNDLRSKDFGKVRSFHPETGPSPSPSNNESTPEMQTPEVDPTRKSMDVSQLIAHDVGTDFTKEEIDILLAPTEDEIVEMKEGKIAYVSNVHYRNRLNKAFGPGNWKLVALSDAEIVADGRSQQIIREFGLFVRGRFISQAIGEQRMFGGEQGRALEACKSSALKRCCKDLGMFSELQDKRKAKRFMEIAKKNAHLAESGSILTNYQKLRKEK